MLSLDFKGKNVWGEVARGVEFLFLGEAFWLSIYWNDKLTSSYGNIFDNDLMNYYIYYIVELLEFNVVGVFEDVFQLLSSS